MPRRLALLRGRRVTVWLPFLALFGILGALAWAVIGGRA